MGKRWNRGGHANVCGRSAARGEWFHEHDLEWSSRKSQAGTVVRGVGAVEMVRGELLVQSHEERSSSWMPWKEWCVGKCCGRKSFTKEERPVIRRASIVINRPRERGRSRRPISEEQHRAKRIMPGQQISDAKKERIRAKGAGKAYPPSLPLPNLKQDHDRWTKVTVPSSRKPSCRNSLGIDHANAHENTLPIHTTPASLDGNKLNADRDMVVGYMASDPLLKKSWEKDFVPKMNAVKEDRRSRSADNVRSKHDTARAARSPLSSKVDMEASIVKSMKNDLKVYAEIREIPPFGMTERTKKLLLNVAHQRNIKKKTPTRTKTLPNRRGTNLFPPRQPRLKRSNTRLDIRAVPKPLNIEKSPTGRPAMVGSDGEGMKGSKNLFSLQESHSGNKYSRSYGAHSPDMIKVFPGLVIEQDVEMTPTSKAVSYTTSQTKDHTLAPLRHYLALPTNSRERQKEIGIDRFRQEDKDGSKIQSSRGLIAINDNLDSQMRSATSTSQSSDFTKTGTQLSTTFGFKEWSELKLRQIPEQSRNMDRMESFRHNYPQPILGRFYNQRDLEEQEQIERKIQQEKQERQKQEDKKQLREENIQFTPQKQIKDVISCYFDETPSQMRVRQGGPSNSGLRFRMVTPDANSLPISSARTLHNGIDLELSDKSDNSDNEVKTLSPRRLSTPSMIDFDTPCLPWVFPSSSQAVSSHNPMLSPALTKAVEERVEEVEEDVSGFSDGFDGRDLNPLISRPVPTCSVFIARESRTLYVDEEFSSVLDTESWNKRVVDFVNLPEVVVSNHVFENIWSNTDHSSQVIEAWSPAHVVQQSASVKEQDASGREPSANSKHEAICHSMHEENSRSQIIIGEKMDGKRLTQVAKQDVSGGKDNSVQLRRVIAKRWVEEDSKSQSDTVEGLMEATSRPQDGEGVKENDKRLTKKLISEKDVDCHDRDSHFADLAELYAIDSQFLERGWRESAGSSR